MNNIQDQSGKGTMENAQYWQLCPKCLGQGVVSKPNYVPSEVSTWGATSVTHLCDVCNGSKILATPSPNNRVTEPLQTNNSNRVEGEQLYRWVKASEKWADSPDYWLATNEMQQGKCVLCRYRNVIYGFGRFTRLDGRMYFYYTASESHNLDDDGIIGEGAFDELEWLEPLTHTEQLRATDCRICGKPHELRDKDAGTDRELERLCLKCFGSQRSELPSDSLVSLTCTDGSSIQHLLNLLAEKGGEIVSTASLPIWQIENARASGRMYVDNHSLGFVWMPPNERMPETPEEVKEFEKWFPIPVELPEELKTLDWYHNKNNPL